MSREAWISILGMEELNPNLFSKFSYPSDWDINTREDFLDELRAQTAELELLYSDSKILEGLIGTWSRRRRPIWDHLIETTKYKYNPISNWNRDEHTLVTETRNLTSGNTQTRNLSTDSTQTKNLQNTHTGTDTNLRTDDLNDSTTETSESSGNTLNSIASYDSNSLEAREKNEHSSDSGRDTSVDHTGTQTNLNTKNLTDAETGTVTDASTETGSVTDASTDTGTVQHETTYTAEGNVGVLSNQEMIKLEREIADFDIVQIIVDEFIKRFCLLVY